MKITQQQVKVRKQKLQLRKTTSKALSKQKSTSINSSDQQVKFAKKRIRTSQNVKSTATQMLAQESEVKKTKVSHLQSEQQQLFFNQKLPSDSKRSKDTDRGMNLHYNEKKDIETQNHQSIAGNDNCQPIPQSNLTTGSIAQLLNKPSLFSPIFSKFSQSMDSIIQYGDDVSSMEILQPHPLNSLISQFEQLRSNSRSKNKGCLDDFLKAFAQQMKDLDYEYCSQQEFLAEDLNNKQLRQQESPSLDKNLQSEYQQRNEQQRLQVQPLTMNDEPDSCQSNTISPDIKPAERYETFDFTPNSLQFFYPKEIRKQLSKKKLAKSERLVQGLRIPNSQAKLNKALERMAQMSQCQQNFISVVTQKIDKKSKHIKKQEKIVSENLKRKRIFLDLEKFDILSILQSSQNLLSQQVHQQIEMSHNNQKMTEFSKNKTSSKQQNVTLSKDKPKKKRSKVTSITKEDSNYSSDEAEARPKVIHIQKEMIATQRNISTKKAQSMPISKQKSFKVKVNQSSSEIASTTLELTKSQNHSVGINENLSQQSSLEIKQKTSSKALKKNESTKGIPAARIKNKQSQVAHQKLKKGKSNNKVQEQNDFVQTYMTENGSLYMKIILPDQSKLNITQSSPIDDQNHLLQQNHDDLEQPSIEDYQNFSHSNISQLPLDFRMNIPNNQATKQDPNYESYLGLGISRSEPLHRFGTDNILGGTHHRVHNPKVELVDGIEQNGENPCIIETHFKEQQYLNASHPESVSTYYGSEIPHDLIIASKPSCSRQIHFFDFDHKVEEDFNQFHNSSHANDLEIRGHQITNLIALQKDEKFDQYYMQHQNNRDLNMIEEELPLFQDSNIGAQKLNHWDALIEKHHDIEINDKAESHDHSYFNYDKRI